MTHCMLCTFRLCRLTGRFFCNVLEYKSRIKNPPSSPKPQSNPYRRIQTNGMRLVGGRSKEVKTVGCLHNSNSWGRGRLVMLEKNIILWRFFGQNHKCPLQYEYTILNTMGIEYPTLFHNYFHPLSGTQPQRSFGISHMAHVCVGIRRRDYKLQ